MTEDSALQLVLIVDYIVDWARDVFRPSVLRQLISLTNGKDYDDITVFPDSDVASKRGDIYNWLQDTGTARDYTDHALLSEGFGPEEPDGVLWKLPNTQLGIVRPFFTTKYHFTGLHITADNVESLLILCGGMASMKSCTPSQRAARDLLSMIVRWDEMLVVSGADLDDIELAWTGTARQEPGSRALDDKSKTDHYAIFEYRCFVASSWDVVRELTVYTVSTEAYEALRMAAAFQLRHPYIEALSESLRHCSRAIMMEAIECLRSGSAWQVLLCAISSTLLSLYPVPEVKRTDSTPPVTCIAFGHTGSLRVRTFVESYIRLATKQPPRKLAKDVRDSGWLERTGNRSFARTSNSETPVDELNHESSTCLRCQGSLQDHFSLKHWDPSKQPLQTAYDAILVASLQEDLEAREWSTIRRQKRYDWCLFVLERNEMLSSVESFAIAVEDLSQEGFAYHTIQHDIHKAAKPASCDGVRWNLPFPYRRLAQRQRKDLSLWIEELQGQDVQPADFPPNVVYPMDIQQILLHFLKSGLAYDTAVQSIKNMRDAARQKRPNLSIRDAFSCEMDDYFRQKRHEQQKEQEAQAGNRPRLSLPKKLILRGET